MCVRKLPCDLLSSIPSGDITQQGYEKKKSKLLSPYLGSGEKVLGVHVHVHVHVLA